MLDMFIYGTLTPMKVRLIGEQLRQTAQLRRANVGRRRLCCGRLNSGEAAVVEGDDLFGFFPPAKQPSSHKQPNTKKGHSSIIAGAALFIYKMLLLNDGYDASAVHFDRHAVAGFDERQLLVDGYFSDIDGFCIAFQREVISRFAVDDD